MYSNFTFTTAGELSTVIGVHKNISDPIALSTYTDLDNLRITAAQQKVQYVLDLVEPSKIIFDDFEPEENSLISTLSYNTMGNVAAIVNKRLSTAAKRREDGSLRFADAVDGHCATLHGMLRILFANNPPNDTILGHAHGIFTTVLYNILVTRVFNKDYALIDSEENELAAIRYACACITAKKLFQLNCNINDVSIPLTTIMFNRVDPKTYATNNNIITYDSFMGYLTEKTSLKNIDKSTLVNGIIRILGARALVILECGVDFMIDCMLSKAINRILSHNLYKILGLQQYDNMQRKIIATYSQQASLNIQT